MLKNNALSGSNIQGNQKSKFFSSFLLSTVVVIALLFGIGIGAFGSSALIVVIGAILLTIIIIAPITTISTEDPKAPIPIPKSRAITTIVLRRKDEKNFNL